MKPLQLTTDDVDRCYPTCAKCGRQDVDVSRSGRCHRCARQRPPKERPWRKDAAARAFVEANPAGATLEAVGAVLGMTRERTRQIEAEALRWFRIGCLLDGLGRDDVLAFLATRARTASDDLSDSRRVNNGTQRLEAWVRSRVLVMGRAGLLTRHPDDLVERIVAEWDRLHPAPVELDASMEPAESTVALRGEVDALASRAAWVRDVARVAQACAIAEWIRERRARRRRRNECS